MLLAGEENILESQEHGCGKCSECKTPTTMTPLKQVSTQVGCRLGRGSLASDRPLVSICPN